MFVERGDKQNLANLLEKLAKLQQRFDMKIYENQLIAVIEWNMKTIAVCFKQLFSDIILIRNSNN